MANDDLQDVKLAICSYLVYFREKFPGKFTPKQHILEDHLVPFIQKWKIPIVLMGETGIEACHKDFNKLNRTMCNISNNLQRVTCVMKEYMVSIHPKVRKHIVLPKPRRKGAGQA